MLEMWTNERKVLWEEFKDFVFDKNKSYSIMFYFTLVDCVCTFLLYVLSSLYVTRETE